MDVYVTIWMAFWTFVMNGMSTDHTIVSGTHVCIHHFDILDNV